jgi:hypothetical protein
LSVADELQFHIAGDSRMTVFASGATAATLYEILAGQPPYAGKRAELQYKARTAKLEDAFARLHGCGSDAELIALTKHYAPCSDVHSQPQKPRHHVRTDGRLSLEP